MNLRSIEAMLTAQTDARAIRNDCTVAVLISLGHCEHVCLLCADACSREKSVARLDACIRVNLDCAAICAVTAAVLVRQTDNSCVVANAQLRSCAMVCEVCAELCASHARHHDHCQICADVCRDCQEKCSLMLGEVSPIGASGNNQF